ncbi:MAG: Cytochrome c biogenesis protein, transmembrane region [Promethearchaeota archaeon]|nr:MAG: Cytochrome c biogenesis protein, transmembrane region [Candidatus Lokiarchaeota archaeon]
MEVDLIVSFVSGMVIGITPCILLMLSAFGTSLVMIEEKNKFIKISLGLILGMILGYLLISIIFVTLVRILDVIYLFKYIFAGVLIFIGVWQILESGKAKSIIFGTPEKVKTVMKDFIDKNSGLYAFLVGIIFVLIKIPCFGGVYLAILYDLRENPLLFLHIGVYLLGLMIPVVLILTLLRIGLESSTINEFRLKYRTHLRILSGVILIVLAFYLLLYDLFFP